MCKIEQKDFERLKEEVEKLVGRIIKTPRDFDYLSRQIEGYMGESISVSTLKRMWGYVKANSKPSLYNQTCYRTWWGIPTGHLSVN